MKARIDKLARGGELTPRLTVRREEGSDVASDIADQEDIHLEQKFIRRPRKHPRSKMQAAVDAVEDAGSSITTLDLKGFDAPRVSTRIWDLSHLLHLDLSVRAFVETSYAVE